MSKKKKLKQQREQRRILEAQKAQMKSYGYVETKSAESSNSVVKNPDQPKDEKLAHQLPVAQIRKDFGKIVVYTLFAVTVLVYLKIANLDFNAIRGFLRF